MAYNIKLVAIHKIVFKNVLIQRTFMYMGLKVHISLLRISLQNKLFIYEVTDL